MTVLEDFRHETLTRENRAAEAMYVGDPEPFKQMWSHADDVSLFGAFGPCKTGWSELSNIFDWVASRYRDGTVSLDYEVVHEGTDLAYTVGYEHGELNLDGGPRKKITIRVTNVYRRENGQWRLVHRHGDFAPADESAASRSAPPGLTDASCGTRPVDHPRRRMDMTR